MFRQRVTRVVRFGLCADGTRSPLGVANLHNISELGASLPYIVNSKRLERKKPSQRLVSHTNDNLASP
jgi:hypothetical protein